MSSEDDVIPLPRFDCWRLSPRTLPARMLNPASSCSQPIAPSRFSAGALRALNDHLSIFLSERAVEEGVGSAAMLSTEPSPVVSSDDLEDDPAGYAAAPRLAFPCHLLRAPVAPSDEEGVRMNFGVVEPHLYRGACAVTGCALAPSACGAGSGSRAPC